MSDKESRLEIAVKKAVVTGPSLGDKGFLTPKDLYQKYAEDSYKTTCCHGNGGGCDSCYGNCDM